MGSALHKGLIVDRMEMNFLSEIGFGTFSYRLPIVPRQASHTP
jgi:hypothetical protein